MGARAPQPDDTIALELAAGGDGDRWRLFAAVMLGVAGALNVVHGIAAISSSGFYVKGVGYVVADLPTLGWIVTALGALQLGAAVSIVGRTRWGWWVGVVSAIGNSLTHALLLPSSPVLWAALLAIDVLVLYALVVRGRD